MDWYYADESDAQTKFDENELSSLIESGKITAKTLVWNKSMDDWVQASLVKPELFSASPSVTTPYNAPTTQGPAYYAPPADGLGITSMILGILGVSSMCLYGIGIVPGVAALIFGYLSKHEIRDASGQPKRSGMALAGIIMGYISSGLSLLFILAIIGIIAFAATSASSTMPVPSPLPTPAP